ncbi:inositol polyphosphate 1-phosphatase-like [Scleropages formosus]|uniref:Inositol polyphosphate 1-phosphatase-like n=1 Tax=Scleropages formosus TaxID=113540 RepID=A0A0P7X644_SCLFO|nr:inositol polyphosphate 1-phosphatase-like [Scleropages formosus]XP_018581437.1 inositol polyphosphate 1-phosphatase-like [Scleropages formosus]KPP69645.1 inositol polyphosphate 1-phosphatase-like [Scleropages formosus]
MAQQLLRLLLRVSEKAANVARICRQETPLFELLVQEKTGEDKNKKFVRDFKTLADVVIQEMIRHDVCVQFPELKGFIHGEESNKFDNGLGESVLVTVCALEEETATMLATVLDGNHKAASLLAAAIHQDLQLTDEMAESLELPLHPSDLALWIDPIDATSQYIKGQVEVVAEGEICPSGLQCALVLIGAYLRATGEPVIGVINQPFAERDLVSQSWKGQHFWGVSCGSINAFSIPKPICHTAEESLSIVLSSSEKQVVKDALTPLCGGRFIYAAGAGYKTLCVILNLADVYVLSEGSTFKWDSCASHALLRAMGGGVIDLKESLLSFEKDESPRELTYHQARPGSQGAERWANHGGLIAYLDNNKLKTVIGALLGKL